MTIKSVTVTEFKAHCLAFIRDVESGGGPLVLTRRGRVVARLVGPPGPPGSPGSPAAEPLWLQLRGRGRLGVPPGHSVIDEGDFDAAR
jgi:prevent-host-death family protein